MIGIKFCKGVDILLLFIVSTRCKYTYVTEWRSMLDIFLPLLSLGTDEKDYEYIQLYNVWSVYSQLKVLYGVSLEQI